MIDPNQRPQPDPPPATYTIEALANHTEAAMAAMSDADWNMMLSLAKRWLCRERPQALLRIVRARADQRCFGGDPVSMFATLMRENRLVLGLEGDGER